MYNRRYEKVFLMLRQETAGYALGKRPPWGSCIMELKNGRGKLHFTAQGLKPMVYDVYVLAGAESIFCGEVCPEQKEGKCELKWNFDPEAVGDGKKAEDFQTVLVHAVGDAAPLVAYFGEKRAWRKDFIPREKLEESVTLQAAEAAILEKPAPVILLEKKEAPKAVEKEKDTNGKVAEQQKESYHGSFRGLLAKFRKELEELEETGVLSPEETERIRSMGKQKAVEKVEENVGECGYPLGEGWQQIALEELVLFPQVPLNWRKEFFFLLPYRKYHHLLLKETPEGIWLGLPGRFNAADVADADVFGFHEFRRTNGDWGYWLCFLERNS